MHRFGYLPRRGERLHFNGFDFQVMKADRRRIDTLQVQRDRREAATG
jgi:magnesium and cobalt transporter